MKVFDSKSLRNGYIEQVFQHVNRKILLLREKRDKYYYSPSIYRLQEIYNKIIVNSELAKRSMWIMKNYERDTGHKCKSTAAESKKRLEQISKQLKV